jgi:hypothetical protein
MGRTANMPGHAATSQGTLITAASLCSAIYARYEFSVENIWSDIIHVRLFNGIVNIKTGITSTWMVSIGKYKFIKWGFMELTKILTWK